MKNVRQFRNTRQILTTKDIAHAHILIGGPLRRVRRGGGGRREPETRGGKPRTMGGIRENARKPYRAASKREM